LDALEQGSYVPQLNRSSILYYVRRVQPGAPGKHCHASSSLHDLVSISQLPSSPCLVFLRSHPRSRLIMGGFYPPQPPPDLVSGACCAQLGTKLLGKEVRIAARLVKKVLRGKGLTRRERQQLTLTTADIFRLVPFAVFVIVPFMELLLPVRGRAGAGSWSPGWRVFDRQVAQKEGP
jgi:hypothetical protein